MRLVDLLALYAVVGVACSVAVYLRQRPSRSAWVSALVTVPLWPVWAPMVLTSPSEELRTRLRGRGDTARRIEAALAEAMEAARGSRLSALLPEAAVESIVRAVEASDRRHGELTRLLARPGFDRSSASSRVEALSGSGRARALATARLHLANVERLHELRERDERSLADLVELVEALRTQLVLARFAGSTVEGVGDIVSELWARVEGLGEALEEPQGVLAELSRDDEAEPVLARIEA